MNSNTESDLWFRHLRQWSMVGPPLRPARRDVALMEEAVAGWRGPGDRPPVGVVFGVTPEFPAMEWPAGSRVYALDNAFDMIRYIWPAAATHTAGAVAGDWTAVPFGDGSVDAVLCDGGFSLFDWPAGYRRLLQSIDALLAPGGRLVVRFFARPEDRETPEQVIDDLTAGRIGNFHIFKWRFAMALYEPGSPGIRVGDIWERWHAAGLTVEAVAEMNDWPDGIVRTIDAYRESDNRLSFPAVAELRSLLGEQFLELDCRVPDYEIGDRCPVLILEKR